MRKRGFMKHTGWQWLAVSSLLLGTLLSAETRPQYGGTLRVTTRIAPAALDPADRSQPDSVARRNLGSLMFDTLVTLDSRVRLQPALATSWKAEPGNQRWQFWLRRGVKFHDGTPLTPEAVAASLRVANAGWHVLPAADSVIIERDTPAPDLGTELSCVHNAIAKRGPGGSIIGTGPFHVTEWQSGKKLTLAAEEGYWAGRPFLDTIEIEMGKPSRDQLIALELGKVDVAEVAPDQVHHASTEGRRVLTSSPIELMAIVFTRSPQTPDEAKLRDALALSIDRISIRNVVLQGEGELSAAILPTWVSGYAFIFPAEQNLARARQERSEVRQVPSWTLGYDAGDPLARVIAERITLNARDAGLVVQAATSASADLRLMRIPLASLDSQFALGSVAAITGLPSPKRNGAAADDLYQSEVGMLQTQRLIPLFHLPVSYALNSSVQDWNHDRDGSWHLDDVWVGSNRP
jgi:peptide/nickel transport system substrate-binding protein